MAVTSDQVLALAPDAASAGAGKKLAARGHWRLLGRSGRALWGECQGSALYQIRVDLASLSVKCSCPSRKFPCKHGLGLLLLFAADPAAVPEGPEVEWVSEWLDRREQAAVKKETVAQAKAAGSPPADPKAQERRAEKRHERVRAGVEGLERWLDDLVRNGLAGLETHGSSFWESQAARLVDAQASGLAARVRRLGGIPGSGPGWTEALLLEMGRLALLAHAFGRLDQLEASLAEEVRQLVGFTVEKEAVLSGPVVTDRFTVLGQRVEDDEHVRVQRTWLRGERGGRDALVLQFAAGSAPFHDLYLPGTAFEADVAPFPGVSGQRVLVTGRHGVGEAVSALPGEGSVSACLSRAAGELARAPWLDRVPLVLGPAVLVGGERAGWALRDGEGLALSLAGGDPWRLLALSGGHPVVVAGEWDGSSIVPLGLVADGAYHPLVEASA